MGNDHKCGEIWAEILYVVSNKLIEKHGFADSLFPSSDSDFYRFIPRSDGSVSKVPNHGNTLMLQLIVNGMKTQPCDPTFIQARFASRGLGLDAKNITFISNPHINGFQVPPECN
ncbi:hypothetical protein OPQ81_008178 [Rhizoctonia solani]|nr:hypothetical protein OPQ81_008178 [Rhizoctonia solani]